MFAQLGRNLGMGEDYREPRELIGVKYIKKNGKTIWQQNTIGMPKREESTCKSVQASNVHLMQEAITK